MCYRVVLPPLEEILERYSIKSINYDLSHINFGKDAYPSNYCPILKQKDNKYEVVPMQWGLIPYWAKDPKIGKKLYNARIETIDVKPSFKKASKNICYLPVKGFYEKDLDNKPKLYQEDNIFNLKCIYDVWNMKETFAVLTQEATKEIENIHNRMPVVIDNFKQ